jgi:hypothetical protein
MDTLPFTLWNVFGGFANADGLLRNEGTHLCVEYQVRDGVVGVLKSNVREVRIPLDQIVSATLNRGWLGLNWFGIKLVIQVSHMDWLQDMPDATQGRMNLRIARADRPAAEAFVDRLHDSEPASTRPAAV